MKKLPILLLLSAILFMNINTVTSHHNDLLYALTPIPAITTHYDNIINSVVHIESRRMTDDRLAILNGAGFWYMNKYIITCNHVVENALLITVRQSDGKFIRANATVVARDPVADIAILKLANEDDYKKLKVVSLPLANSDNLYVGQDVWGIGHPLGFENTVTKGIVSYKNRRLVPYPNIRYVQTDAAINTGNSGGILINALGEIVGMNDLIISKTGSSAGIAMAVASNDLKKVIDILLRDGKKEYVSIGIKTLSNERVTILEIVEFSPSARAGLQKDDVIIEVNNRPIISHFDINDAMFNNKPGDIVTVKVIRKGAIRTFNVASQLFR